MTKYSGLRLLTRKLVALVFSLAFFAAQVVAAHRSSVLSA